MGRLDERHNVGTGYVPRASAVTPDRRRSPYGSTALGPLVTDSTDGGRPRLSVAMATYNGARYLDASLESIAAQSERPVEVVICDDGSVDDTVAIVERFARTAPFPVVIRRNPQRLGHAGNFMLAASMCTGDLVAFSDQDDVWMSEKVKACVDAFSVADPPSLVVHRAELVDSDLRSLDRRWPHWTAGRRRSAECRPHYGYYGCLLCFDRQLLEVMPSSLRPCADGYESGHDEWVCFLAPLARGITLLDAALIRYRQHESNQFGAPAPGHHAEIHSRIDPDLVEARARNVQLYRDILEVARRDDSIRATPENIGRWAGAHARMVDSLRERILLYRSATAAARLRTWVRLAATGAYFDEPNGGLGWRALAKDTTVALLGCRGAERFLTPLRTRRHRRARPD